MNQLLPFKLGTEVYALELPEIQEVVENPQIHGLPGAPETLAGVIAFHGRIVPVVDLPLLLGFPAGNRFDRLIVLSDRHGPMALWIDQMCPIMTLNLTHEILSQSSSEADCIRGVLNCQGEIISLLDIDQLQAKLEQLCAGTGG